jgi:hypothetical protein
MKRPLPADPEKIVVMTTCHLTGGMHGSCYRAKGAADVLGPTW